MPQHELEAMLAAWRAWREQGGCASRDVAMELADRNRERARKGENNG